METLSEKRRKAGKLGGRPKGKQTDIEIARLESLKRIKQRVFEATDALINAQMGSAIGSQYLYKIKTTKHGRGEPIRVESPYEMECFLRGDYDHDGDKYDDTEYYFLTAKDPETKASEALLNRTHGKPKESVELSNPDGNLKTIIVNKYGKDSNN